MVPSYLELGAPEVVGCRRVLLVGHHVGDLAEARREAVVVRHHDRRVQTLGRRGKRGFFRAVQDDTSGYSPGLLT